MLLEASVVTTLVYGVGGALGVIGTGNGRAKTDLGARRTHWRTTPVTWKRQRYRWQCRPLCSWLPTAVVSPFWSFAPVDTAVGGHSCGGWQANIKSGKEVQY